LSPDRKFVATGGRTGKAVENGPKGGEVILWDVATKRERTTLVGHESWVTSVAFSPDGKLLATGGLDRTVKVWHMPSGNEAVTLPHQTDDIGRVAFSPDGRVLATAMRYGGGIKLWNTRNWTERAALADKADLWFDAVFSPDSKFLALAGGRRADKRRDVGEVKLLNLMKNEVETLLQRSRYVFSAAFSPDARRLAAVVDDRTVVVWDLATKKEIAVIKRHIASSSDQVFFLSTGDEIAFTTTAPSRVEIWKIDQ
jgi:WD40 repeat protein